MSLQLFVKINKILGYLSAFENEEFYPPENYPDAINKRQNIEAESVVEYIRKKVGKPAKVHYNISANSSVRHFSKVRRRSDLKSGRQQFMAFKHENHVERSNNFIGLIVFFDRAKPSFLKLAQP